MKINFVVQRILPDKFSGGIYCILRHANELVGRGHEVRIIAYPKSEKPNWIKVAAPIIVPGPIRALSKNLPISKRLVLFLADLLDYVSVYYKGHLHQKAIVDGLLSSMPKADITIATAQETAAIVARHGKGVKCYFCQHDESVFYDDPVEIAGARATYGYGLIHIVNSSWLKARLHDYIPLEHKNIHSYKVLNGIDPKIFFPKDVETSKSDNFVRVISYGGRDAKWKGFREMAMAMREAREMLPGINIEWNVFGDALLPPSNNIASYNSLGFLKPAALADAYREHDILFSASWYESFPLFPLEAMACGLAVITTEPGTEDYAVNGDNCLIVESKNISSLTNALVRLVADKDLRLKLSDAGKGVAKFFNWSCAGQSMEGVLNAILQVNGKN